MKMRQTWIERLSKRKNMLQGMTEMNSKIDRINSESSEER